jgi:sugar/nucleoside kinase (ribokinase family)
MIKKIEVPAISEDLVVDSNGAGDALVGGFISGLTRGFEY